MEVYAFNDPNNFVSSSGGAFKAIVEEIKKKDESAIIYGAAFDEEFNVKHIRATTKDEISKLFGSKYVRSNTENIKESIASDLKDGKLVCFSGTPCQVATIRRYIENKDLPTDRLLLVDIICHGVIQEKIWESFKKWIEIKEKSKLVDYSFRYNMSRWKSYPSMAKFANGKVRVNTFHLRRYTEIFYSDLALSEGCYRCPFTNTNRISDITLGDFWGIRKIMPSFPCHEQVSQILINSDKGIEIIKEIARKKGYYLEKCEDSNFFQYQEALVKPTNRPTEADDFWKDYTHCPFEVVLKKYAGYNFCGLIKHLIKKTLGELGIITIIKETIKH